MYRRQNVLQLASALGLSAGALKADKPMDGIVSYCITHALEEAGGVGTEER